MGGVVSALQHISTERRVKELKDKCREVGNEQTAVLSLFSPSPRHDPPDLSWLPRMEPSWTGGCTWSCGIIALFIVWNRGLSHQPAADI